MLAVQMAISVQPELRLDEAQPVARERNASAPFTPSPATAVPEEQLAASRIDQRSCSERACRASLSTPSFPWEAWNERVHAVNGGRVPRALHIASCSVDEKVVDKQLAVTAQADDGRRGTRSLVRWRHIALRYHKIVIASRIWRPW